MDLSRIDLIAKHIKREEYKRYLEIGVNDGICLLSIQCPSKTGVDPSPKIGIKTWITSVLKYPKNIRTKIIKKTSDDFFENNTSEFDVTFIDGLHTYEQVLRDFCNAYNSLSLGGTIFLHDTLPPHRASSIRAQSYNEAESLNVSGWTGDWCGDVWKILVHCQRHFPDLKIHTYAHDFGLSFVRKEKTNKLQSSLDENILKLDYTFFENFSKKHITYATVG